MEKLAIVVPCYNEEEVLKIASEALRGVLDDLIRKGKIAEDSFILFVNDGSKDRTWELIEEEHQAHPVQVCGVKLAGNVGHQFALTAGLITAMDLSDVTVSTDGRVRVLPAGGHLVLTPGESVTLPPRLYHAFWAEKGTGKVLIGEVSKVNDDCTDNRFYENMGRFPEIEEDEAPYRLLCNEYPSFKEG